MWTIIMGMLVALWVVGFKSHVGGVFIHLLLVAAALVFVMNRLTGRRTF